MDKLRKTDNITTSSLSLSISLANKAACQREKIPLKGRCPALVKKPFHRTATTEVHTHLLTQPYIQLAWGPQQTHSQYKPNCLISTQIAHYK